MSLYILGVGFKHWRIGSIGVRASHLAVQTDMAFWVLEKKRWTCIATVDAGILCRFAIVDALIGDQEALGNDIKPESDRL